MILRRFSEHVRNQSWFTVFLDFIVVVGGIYIGLQADAWMSAKQDRALEVEYMERMIADMEDSMRAQLEIIQSFDASNVAIDYLAEQMRSGTFDDADEERLIIGLDSVGWVPPVPTNMVTVRELQMTGNIALIRDVSVRTALGEFERSYSSAEASASQNRAFMAASSTEMMTWSFMAPKVPGEHRSVTEAEDGSYGYAHQYDAERMLKSPDTAKITSWISGWGKYHGAVLVQHHNDTVALHELLSERLAEIN